MKGPMKFNDNNSRVSDNGSGFDAGGHNRLQKEAGDLLMDSGASRLVTMARFNSGDVAAANASQDQVSRALEQTSSPELFDKLGAQDKQAAADFAVAHTELQTHAMHGQDTALAEQVRLRVTGSAERG